MTPGVGEFHGSRSELRLKQALVKNINTSLIFNTALYLFTEDIDPSVGRFRNMIQTAVVPIKVRPRVFIYYLFIFSQTAFNMQSFIYIYTHRYIYTYICVYICIYIFVYVWIYMCIYMDT